MLLIDYKGVLVLVRTGPFAVGKMRMIAFGVFSLRRAPIPYPFGAIAMVAVACAVAAALPRLVGGGIAGSLVGCAGLAGTLSLAYALGLTPHFTDIITPDTHNGLKKHRQFFGDWPQRAQRTLEIPRYAFTSGRLAPQDGDTTQQSRDIRKA